VLKLKIKKANALDSIKW